MTRPSRLQILTSIALVLATYAVTHTLTKTDAVNLERTLQHCEADLMKRDDVVFNQSVVIGSLTDRLMSTEQK